jgi:hypothetical protein
MLRNVTQFGVVLVLATTAAVPAYLLTRSGAPPAQPPSAEFADHIPPVGTDPFPENGVRVSTTAASKAAGYSVPFPDSAIADSASLSDVWFRAGKTDSGDTYNEVVLDYVGSGTRIEIAPALHGLATDPKETFTEMADGLGMPADSVQTVHGVPALVQPPVESLGRVNGFVEIVLHGLRITVTGSAKVEDLIATANSIP